VIERVVFDTSTLIGALLRSSSVPGQAFRKALDLCELCTCTETIAELATVLARKRFEKSVPEEARSEFVELIRQKAKLFMVADSDLANVSPPCRDVSDNIFLALSRVAGADVVVSSDHDLLVMHPWRGTAILTPAQFLAEFGS
jgi:uncharacterized protein